MRLLVVTPLLATKMTEMLVGYEGWRKDEGGRREVR
jgi:hypothetical protein